MFGNATLRGGQTLAHDVHMWGQLVRWGIHGIALTVVLVPSVALFRTTTAHEWRLVGTGTLAQAKLALGYARHSLQSYEWREGKNNTPEDRGHRQRPQDRTDPQTPAPYVYSKAWLGLWIGLGGMFLCAVLFWVRGRRLDRARRVRGAEMATARELRRRVRPLSAPPMPRPCSPAFATDLLSHRRDPLAQASRDPAHHGLGHHRIRKDRPDLRPGLTDPEPERALHPLRQDGDLHPVVL